MVARKRMFTLDVVDQQQFLDMPATSRCLYFELGMRADDDGFIGNIPRLLAWLNATPDDLRILIAKGFLIEFASGVIVITDWLRHNTLKGDRYNPSNFDEKALIELNSSKRYILLCGTKMEPQISIDKNSKDNSTNVVSSSIDCQDNTVESVNKSLITDILINLAANSKIRQKIIEKYGGSQND